MPDEQRKAASAARLAISMSLACVISRWFHGPGDNSPIAECEIRALPVCAGSG